MKFEVGDKVRIVNGFGDSSKDNGKCFVIDYVLNDFPFKYLCGYYQKQKLNLSNQYYKESELELVEDQKEEEFYKIIDTYWVGAMPNYLNTENRICTYVSNKTEEIKMDETIKMYNAKNLKEAKRQAEEEKANLEVMRAKQVYKSLINTKEMHEREIKIRQEEIKKLELELAVFDKK